MGRAVFQIADAGPHVTVQDTGRFGRLRYGVPASGPMDRMAFAIANRALGNPADTPGIEISLGGLVLDCTEGEVSFAVVGGGFQVSVGAARFGSWRIESLRAGQRLSIRPGPWGSWTYLVFAGQMQTRRWLGSAATHGPSDLGGGRVVTGDSLTVEAAELRMARHGKVACPVTSRPRSRIRVVLGPQDRFFSPETIAALLSKPFTLSDAYDRMGVRLSGPSLRPEAVLTMPSEAIVRGSIQVAGDGVATVLLADHQTTGGYPKIATIISEDLDGFAQLRSRASVAFHAVTPQSAIEALRRRRVAQARFLARLG